MLTRSNFVKGRYRFTNDVLALESASLVLHQLPYDASPPPSSPRHGKKPWPVSLTRHLHTNIYSRSVDPRKLRVGVKYYVVHSCIHQNHILRLQVCTRTVRANCAQKCRCFAAVYFAFSFMVVKPSQSKQVEVSLASYLCLHHTRLYYFSTYFTHENYTMAFMATL